MGWKDLDIKLKAELIKLGVLSGIRDKNKIIQMYDLSIELPILVRKFEEGGFVNTELGEEQQVGLERLIQDYLVQDPTVMFGIKTLEDSYKVSEALRKFELVKLQLQAEELNIIEEEVEKFIDKGTVAEPIRNTRTVIQKGNLKHLNNPEIQKLLEQSSSIINSEEPIQQEEPVITTDETKVLEDTTPVLSEEEKNIKPETDYTEGTPIQMYLEYLKNKKEQGYDLHKIQSIAKENTEEYVSELKEKIKKEEQLRKQKEEILKQIRLDSIQKAVLDSLIKELKPNTIQAQTSSNVEVPKETIQEVQDIIMPKYEKNTPEYYADSTAKHINRVLDEHFLQNPTLYSLLTDNFNFNKIQESFIHKEVNKEAFRLNTDNSYKDKRQPLEHLHRAIVIHTSGGKKQGDLTSLSGKERVIDKETRKPLYNKDNTPKYRLAGAHFYISQNGEIYLLVGEDEVAFHSSVGLMFDAIDPNSFAFGIELEGYSYEEGKSNEHKNTDFSKNPKLLESLGKVIAYLCNKYNIPYELIQTHYDVEDYYELNFYKNLGFLKGIEGRKDLNGIEWKPPIGKVDIMPKQYAPIKNYLETHVFKKINNKHAFGGYINNQLPVLFRLFKNGGYKDNPPFILRILNNDKRSVKDWQNNNYQSTHKLSYALTPEGYIIYPEVLEVNGLLHDFTNPKYKHGKWDALDNAIRNNDTLRFSTEELALKYTQEYKSKYPEYFKLFDKGGYISNNPTLALVGKVKKYTEGGYKNPDEPPVSESTGVAQRPLSLEELQFIKMQELLGRVPTQAELIQDERSRQANLYSDTVNTGVVSEAKEDNIKNNFFRWYNNFRYSHPWAEGLNYMPIIGDGMDLISLAGDVNNKNYMTAGLGLGMLALPNFILKPLLKYVKLLNIPDEVWDDLYNKAIKNNNLEEVQQLRDLHFRAKAPNTKIVDVDGNPLTTTHGTNKEFNIFELEGPNITHGDPGDFGYGYYFFPDKRISSYGDRQIYAYLNIENPYDGDWNRNFNRGKSGIDYTRKLMKEARDYNLTKMTDSEIESELFRLANADGVTAISPYSNRIQEIVVPKSNQIKLGDAITYDDAGNIIPLSKRDNFLNPDIRYSWLIPTIPFGLMSYKLFNQNNKEEYKNGGFLFPNLAFSHKFEDGGYSNSSTTPTIDDKPKVVQKGTVGWNPFNVFNRNYKGAPIYESDNFGDSFRLARIDKAPIFIWNGKAYNSNLKPNPLVEAARAWDTQGDLRKIEFQKRIISDPEGTMEYFRKTFPKGEYKTMNSNWDKDIYIIEDMYKNGSLGMPNNVIVKGAKHDIGNLLWDYLNTTNLTYNQKLALMANSYKESMGWTTTKQTNGPARGYYQMENVQFKNYQKWLKQNNLKDNIINETKYIIDLFENHRDKLITPISANLDIEDVINNYKDAEEAHANNHRSAYMHRGYYTKDALRDWDEGDLDAAVKAMEALFEKAGKPRLEDRQKIAWLLSEMYK